MIKSNNILITSVSAKIPLIEAVIQAKRKFDKSMKVYGADTTKTVIAKYFLDYFWQMPKISELNIDEFINYCKKHKISYIIPTRDEDVLFFAKYKAVLLEQSIFPFVADYDAVVFCNDKLDFYQKSQDESVIPTFTNLDRLNLSDNVVVKERFGAGSNRIAINVTKKKAAVFSKGLSNPIFQPYINGDEYSIDSYVGKDGKCIAQIIRSRDLIIDGEAKITTNVNDPVLETKAKKFLESHNIVGHSVLQAIKTSNSYYIIECNVRFGGASTLSYKLGLESFYWFLLESNNQAILSNISNNKLKQIRISKDIYIEG